MNASIGIFDSGLGGLTVFKEIKQLLPQENLIYVGDTARVPYGTKSAEAVIRYSKEICDFLLSRKVKAIVVACNTASALALPILRKKYSIPILGVIEPGVRASLQVTQSHHIGIIGTSATIQSQSYPQAIQNLSPSSKVLTQACPLFVPLVEEGWTDHPVTQQVAHTYLHAWLEDSIDTVILGCTHYPLLKSCLHQVLGKKIRLVDSALETAKALQELLEEKNLHRRGGHRGELKFFTTDVPEKMQELATRFLGHNIDSVERTDLRIHGILDS